MDQTGDLSGRVLLKHILCTEPPRTPVTRSESQAPTSSGVRRSSRLSRKNAEPQTPQDILRRSLKHKMRESIIRKSLPATKRRTASVVVKKMPADVLIHFNEEDTPRHLLRNILQTEPVKSPVVHEKGHPEEPQPLSADKTVTRTRSSIELSGLDLPDVTIGIAASTSKGLSRKRPRRSLNITAFEKRLRDGNDAEEDADISTDDHSSLSLSSSTSLSLKTPFADVRTEKRGLQRKVSNRRKITEEEFCAAVSKRQMGDVSSHDLGQRNLGEVTNSEGFTLGLSKLSAPDITTDILNCNTALYDQPDATIFNFSTVATQDKPTVMASQLLQDMRERQQEEEQHKMEEDGSHTVSPSKDDEYVSAEPQNEEGQNQPDDDARDAVVGSEFEVEQDVVDPKAGEPDDTAEPEQMEAQTEEEDATDSHPDEDDGQGHLSLTEKVSSASETEEEHATDSPPEAAEEGSYSQEEKLGPEEEVAETEEPTEDSQSEDAEEGSDEQVPGSAPSADAVEDVSQSEDVEDVAESQAEEDLNNEQRGEEEEVGDEGQDLEQLERGLEFISRRAHRSEGAIIPPAARWTNDKSKAQSVLGLNTSADRGSHDTSRPQDLAEPLVRDQHGASSSGGSTGAGGDDSSDPLGVTRDIEVSRHRSVPSPEVVPAQGDADQDEESDEEVEEFPSETPAFVREKRKFGHPDPPASVLENIQASSTSEAGPTAKPKQVRRRRTGTTRKPAVFSKAYLMSVFRHFAKTKVSADVYPVLNEILDKFFDRMVEDLETYAAHAKRKTIEVEDAKLLLRRQGYVNDKVPVEVLIEKYLRMEQRKLLIPIATSGNVVIPKTRR